MNFSFLKDIREYEMFSGACEDAERTFASSPAMCALACRKAMELAVRWVYAADDTMNEPWRSNLASLIHEVSFKNAMDTTTWGQLRYIWKLGNNAAHTQKQIDARDALAALAGLFNFVEWIDYCYGPSYMKRHFDPKTIPVLKQALDEQKLRKTLQENAEKDARIAQLEEQVRAQRAQFIETKEQRPEETHFNPDKIPEYETRKRYINVDLVYAGWNLDDSVKTEVEVSGMPNPTSTGFIDYVLLGRNGKPLAIVEAKRTMYDPLKGEQQARLYANCLEKQYGYRPFIFLSNGFETRFMDDGTAAPRACSGVFGREDLERLMGRRGKIKNLSTVPVNRDIAGGGRNRYYQIEAIEAVCQNMEEGHRRSLLVMATGTGKTRTAAGLVDVLSRAGAVTNVLFLADRVALVRQAKNAFQNYLSTMTVCNLCETDDKAKNADARIVFSTYPTILNAVDDVKKDGDTRLFTPAHFDLIIVDEAHRSIFKKYRAIFDYFDSPVVGLTATPKDEVDRNTYDFFQVERGIPTYLYEYKNAVEKDKVLVPYYNIEVQTNFLSKGITYDELSEEDRQRYDDDWEEAQGTSAPDYVEASALDRFVFNEHTIDLVLTTLMDEGIKIKGGECIGKTIVFAQNRKHAEIIVRRFNELYPKLGAQGFCKRVVHTDDYAPTVITDFETKEMPVITVSVDMMDTGIDVPEVVNLVFFKQVKSKVKFWQMIGRGTRLCEGIHAQDKVSGEYEDKKHFFIFDWCSNFEFFRQEQKVAEGTNPESVQEKVFKRQALLAQSLQGADFATDDYQEWRIRVVQEMAVKIKSVKEPLTAAVKLHIREVDKFSQVPSYQVLEDVDIADLNKIAPLVRADGEEELSLRFDALMYAYMVALISGANTENHRTRVMGIAIRLQNKASIPQVREKMELLRRVASEGFLETACLITLEEIREELRNLMKFLVDDSRPLMVETRVTDFVVGRHEGDAISPKEDYEDYKLKVSRYIAQNANRTVIAKIYRNQPMTSFELNELECIFTVELGNEADYRAAYGDTPFGKLVRQVAGLSHEAAMNAFAEFLGDESLSRQQMNFVHKVVDYVETNGFMDLADLSKPPFDQPQSFVRLFDGRRQWRLVQIIRSVNDNAITPAA